MDDHLMLYDELAARHNAAYAAFRTIYEAKNPPPIKPVVERESVFVPVALVIMIVASVIVSGSRTIVEFGGGWIGVAAFVMLEGAIVAYAFFRTRTNFNEARIGSIRKLANWGLALAFAVAIVANVHAVLKGQGVVTAEWLNTGILILVGVSAPTLALISGDMMALEMLKSTSRARKIETEHQQAIAAWMEGLNDAWAREKSRWGVKIEIANEQLPSAVHKVNSLNGMNEQPQLPYSANSSTGYSKRMDARSLISEFFERHPERLNSRLDELVVQIEEEMGVKVGRTSIHNVRREIVQQGQQ